MEKTSMLCPVHSDKYLYTVKRRKSAGDWRYPVTFFCADCQRSYTKKEYDTLWNKRIMEL